MRLALSGTRPEHRFPPHLPESLLRGIVTLARVEVVRLPITRPVKPPYRESFTKAKWEVSPGDPLRDFTCRTASHEALTSNVNQ